MGISDRIEAFINELMKEDNDEWTELRRNELASIFNCVPSQINYVISTRFSPERGYAVESRRGGGGYLRIRRIPHDADKQMIIQAIGSSIDFSNAKACILNLQKLNIIDDLTAHIMAAATSDNSLTVPQPHKDSLRASILKNMIAAI